jgi:hypothetical protein
MATDYPPRRDEPSGWAVGGLLFAATIMLMIGTFQVIVGLAAVINDDFFVVTRNYTFDLDTTAWGWIHLIIGVLVAGAGLSLFGRGTYGAVAAVVLCTLSAIANFFFIPYYPFWSILLIALNVWVIWAVTRPGVIRT